MFSILYYTVNTWTPKTSVASVGNQSEFCIHWSKNQRKLKTNVYQQWHEMHIFINTSLSAELIQSVVCYTNTHTHPFNGPLSRTTRVSSYQTGETNQDFTVKARDSEWQWHQLGRMQVCTSLQTDNHASTPPLSFLRAGCISCHPTNSIKALKA